MERWGKTFLVLLATGLTACEGTSGEPRQAVVVTDSAGIQRVHNHLDVSAVRSIPVEEELRIGSLDGPPETQLYRVRPLAVGPSGEIHVPLLQANEIRVFGPDGSHLRTIGGTGDGPGEFRALSTVFIAGDSLIVLDTGLYRTTTMDRLGTVLETSPLPRTESGMLTPVGWSGDGWIVSVPQPEEWPEHGQFVEQISGITAVPGISGVGDAMREVEGSLADPRRVIRVPGGRMFGMTMGAALTGHRPLWEPRPGWAADEVGHIYRAAPDEYRIDVLNQSGAIVRQIRRTHQPVPISSELKRRFLEHVVAHHDTTEARTEFGTDPVEPYRFRAGLPTSPHLPALGRLLASNEGVLLVERPDLAGDPVALEWSALGPLPSHWDMYDGDGTFLGMMTLPERFTPHVVSREAVLGVLRDELGVEYVVRFRIRIPDAVG